MKLEIGLDVHFEKDGKHYEGEIHAFSGNKAKIEVKRDFKIGPFKIKRRVKQWVELSKLSLISMVESQAVKFSEELSKWKGKINKHMSQSYQLQAAVEEDMKNHKSIQEEIKEKKEELNKLNKEHARTKRQFEDEQKMSQYMTHLPHGSWIKVTDRWSRSSTRWEVEVQAGASVPEEEEKIKSFRGNNLVSLVKEAHKWAWQWEDPRPVI